jgi:glucans biosynthesis protein
MNQDTQRRLKNLGQAPRCGARTRAGTPCRCPAMTGRARCRLHGGKSPGAPKGENNGNFRDGYWTADAITERKWVRDLVSSYARQERRHDQKH